MTAVDVVFHLRRRPGAPEMQALYEVREVYGIRRISSEGDGMTLRVEYDASRLCEKTVAALLRHAGLDLDDKVALV